MARDQDLAGKRFLAVIAPRNFRDEELFEPRAALEARGAKVTVASTGTEAAKGMLGGVAQPHATIDACRMDDFDAVFVVGGMGSPTFLWENQDLHRLLRDAQERGRPIGGICLSGAVLAKAGVLKGKRATVYRTDASIQSLRAGGAIYVGESLVADGRIVTGDGPQIARSFAQKLGDIVVKLGAAVAAE